MKRNDQAGLTALDPLLFSLERCCSSTPGNRTNVLGCGDDGVEESCGKKKAWETQVRKIGGVVIEYRSLHLCYQGSTCTGVAQSMCLEGKLVCILHVSFCVSR